MVFVTEDDDLLSIAHAWAEQARPFAGIVTTRDPAHAIGRMIDDLEIVARCYEAEQMVNEIIYIPL